MHASIPTLLLLLLTAVPVIGETHKIGEVTVTTIDAQEKALSMEVIIKANIHEVWQAMSTSEGLATWLAPKTRVDLRPGGDWLVIFPGSTGGGTIVDFRQEQRIAIHALAPDQFPTVRRERTDVVFTFEAVDSTSTRLTLRQTGWKKGEEWDKAYAYLAEGNAMLLNMLRQRFVDGPTDWRKGTTSR
jgi:uncharacterized protein YndB with AHSA1/START domain